MRNYSILISIFLILLALMTMFFKVDEMDIKKLTLKKYTQTFEYLGTNISVDIYTTSKKKADKAFKGVEEIYQEYDELTSRDVGSVLYDIHNNTSKEQYIKIDSKLYEMIEYGLEWYDESDGLLNINTGDLTDVWNKYRTNGDGVPTKEELNNVDIDIKDIVLLDDNKIKNTHPNIDLDMIRHGYVTEEVGEYLEDNGIKVYLINAGGTMKAGEYYEKTGKYLVGIESPFISDANELLTSIELIENSVDSTGSYQLYYEYKGNLYHSIINPMTGYPAENMVGVTVVTENSADAEALSYVLFLMTIPEGQTFIKEYEDTEVMWAYINSENQKKKVITEHFYGAD